MKIVNRRVKTLIRKDPLVLVQWIQRGVEESRWERETEIKRRYFHHPSCVLSLFDLKFWGQNVYKEEGCTTCDRNEAFLVVSRLVQLLVQVSVAFTSDYEYVI